MVHRFEGSIGQFLGTHSYVMKGTKGQKTLVAGDVFSPGITNGMIPRVEVLKIDDTAKTATVRLSLVLSPKTFNQADSTQSANFIYPQWIITPLPNNKWFIQV